VVLQTERFIFLEQLIGLRLDYECLGEALEETLKK
jgi:hypothetical protein